MEFQKAGECTPSAVIKIAGALHVARKNRRNKAKEFQISGRTTVSEYDQCRTDTMRTYKEFYASTESFGLRCSGKRAGV